MLCLRSCGATEAARRQGDKNSRLAWSIRKIPMQRFARRDRTSGNEIVPSIKDQLKR